MADISAELAAIESAVYGEEVRDAIHDGLEKMNSDLNTAIGTQVIDRATVDSILASEALSLDYSNYTEIVSATNLDTVAGSPGNYWIPYSKAQTLSNMPIQQSGRLYVLPSKGTGANDDGGVQIFVSSQYSGVVEMWIRGWKNYVWSAWRKVFGDDEIFESELSGYNVFAGLTKVTEGKVTITTSAEYSYTCINCTYGETYRVSMEVNGLGNIGVIFADQQDNRLASGSTGRNGFIFSSVKRFAVPNGATKMYVCWYSNSSDISIRKLTAIGPDVYNVPKTMPVSFKKGLLGTTTNFVPNVNHDFDSQYKFCVILVNPGDKFHIDAVYSGSGNRFLYELDSSGNRISSTDIIGTDNVNTHFDSDYTVSANGYGLCLCARSSYDFIVKYYTSMTMADMIDKSNVVPKKSEYEGKTAVFFGTSIPAGVVNINGASYSIPTYVGKLLNMTVINESVGSSMARRGWKDKESSQDPYGWTDIPWQNVFLGMGKNLSECDDLINNYDSKWKNLIGGDFAPAGQDGTGVGKPNSMVDPWPSRIRASSYENKLLPYLNGTKPMPNLFIFEHGHNDIKSFERDTLTGIASINPDDISGFDRSLYGDVMAFYIRLIKSYNPSAKILIVSNYENDSVGYQRVFTSQKEAAESNKVWFCDVANKIGWSDTKKITTTGYWNNGIWVNSGGSYQTITFLSAAFPDRVHPHTDLSGKAIIREAEIIAKFIEANISL